MKTFKSKTTIALVISAVAMFIANISSSMCIFYWFEEVEMPKSLYKN